VKQDGAEDPLGSGPAIMQQGHGRPTFDSTFQVETSRPLKRKQGKAAEFVISDKFWGSKCCTSNCVRQFADQAQIVTAWRASWAKLNQAERRCALLEYANRKLALGQSSHESFLGRKVCTRAWRKLTGISVFLKMRATQWAKAGALRPPTHTRLGSRQAVMDCMHGAIMEIMKHMRNRMPLKGKDEDNMFMPFSHPIQLYRMLEAWYTRSLNIGKPLLLRRPKYRTFQKVLRRPEFSKVRWHRVVDLGRCPKCMLYVYKSMTAPEADRAEWLQLASAHQWRQMSQKKQYWVDRMHAAMNPDLHLYVAMDGGAGNDAVLPHLSAHDLELPNKALKDASTLPAKIMNGLIHGSTRSHVILSPGNILTVWPLNVLALW